MKKYLIRIKIKTSNYILNQLQKVLVFYQTKINIYIIMRQKFHVAFGLSS